MDRVEAIKHLEKKVKHERDYETACALQMAINLLTEEELRVSETRGWK